MVKDIEKNKANIQNNVRNLQAITGDLTKENTDLKAANSTLQTLLEALNKEKDDDDEDKEVEVTEVRKTVKMDKNTSGHLCVSCDKRFKSNGDLEKHIKSKHDVPECPLCEKIFVNKKTLETHVDNCMKDLLVMEPCKECDKRFTKPGLRRHINKGECQKKAEKHTCGECGMICTNATELKQQTSDEHEQRNREVCRHFRRGNCLRGGNCKFAHVGYQTRSENTEPTSRVNNCRNGDRCRWLAQGKCKFNHQNRQNGVPQTSQSERTAHGNRSGDRGRQCWYLNNCRRVPNCPFSHKSLVDFPLLPNRGGRPPVWNTSSSQVNH